MYDTATGTESSIMRVLLYDAEGNDRAVDLSSVDLNALGPQRLLWIHASPGEVDRLAVLGGALSDALSGRECARAFEIMGRTLHFCLPFPPGKRAAKTPIEFIIADTWIVTLCDDWPDFMRRFVEDDRGESLKGRLSPSAFAATLLSDHLDTFGKELFDIDKAIDTLDEQILSDKRRSSPLARLASLRRRLSQLRFRP